MSLTISPKDIDAQTIEFSLVGEILTGYDLDGFFKTLESMLQKKIVINLEGVRGINSIGVASWISHIKHLQDARANIELEKCAILICEQMNMIPQFCANFPVKSAFAPYFCTHCDSEHEVEFQIGPTDTLKTISLQDEMDCPSCGKTMEFDAIKESYLSFLKNR